MKRPLINKLLLLFTLALTFTACTHQSQTPTTSSLSPSPAVTTYSISDIARHTTPTDCWLAIHGKVYNVSNFGEKHPGGEAVYQACGQDATSFFETRPMGSKTPHSDSARFLLPNFYIGELQS